MYFGFGPGGVTGGPGQPQWPTAGSGFGGWSPPSPGVPGAPNPGGSGGGWLADIGRFISQNPGLIVGLAGTAADVYGNVRAGNARDKEIEYARDQAEKDREQRKKEAEDARRTRLLQLLTAGL